MNINKKEENGEYISMIDIGIEAMILAFIDIEIEEETGYSMLKEFKKIRGEII
jgi:hypothetical protein